MDASQHFGVITLGIRVITTVIFFGSILVYPDLMELLHNPFFDPHIPIRSRKAFSF